ncbi:MAG: hypothetical protein IJA02_00210 [Clostridia bacterium]|nr:hypothetical protein [Clostridia bacterium]
MKKLNVKALFTVIVVLLSVGLLCAFLKGDFEKNDADQSLTIGTTYKTEIEKKINEEIERLEAENAEGWREAYIDFLSGYSGEYSQFNEERVFLGYVDDNDVPELFISEGSSHACSVEIFTFENNIVTRLCKTGSTGMARYIERQGIICGGYMGQGVGTYRVYRVENGKVQQVYMAYTNEGWAMDKADLEININGIDVASEELEAFLDSYFGEESILVFEDKVNTGCAMENEAYKDYINNFGK